MMKKKSKINILGCGIAGITCALLLSESHNYDISIIAENIPPNTTSDIAGGIWRPYLMYPEEKALKLALKSYQYYLSDLKKSVEGVRIVKVLEFWRDFPVKEPWMDVLGTGNIYEDDSHDPYHFRLESTTIQIDTSHYLPYLLSKYIKNSIHKIVQEKVANFEDISDCDLIVNCSGIGSSFLLNDKSIYPVKGQTILIEKIAGLNQVYADIEANNHIFIMPRVSDIVIGTTSELNNWDESIDMRASQKILEKASVLNPNIKNAKIISHKVGLRPCRNSFRLDCISTKDMFIVNNYGHGGAGLTTAWGCAEIVCEKVKKFFET